MDIIYFISPASALGCCGAMVSLSFSFWLRRKILEEAYQPLVLRVRKAQQGLEQELTFLRSRVTALQIRIYQVTCIFFALVAAHSDYRVTLGCLLVSFAPAVLLRRARKRRVLRLEQQMEGFLGSLGRALEAAPSLGEALEVTASMSDAPLSEELHVLINELHLGQPLDRALSAWASRINSRVLSLTLATLQVGRQTGGRLPHVLKQAAASLREMERLEGVLRSKTAEGRTQAWVISVVPLPLFFAVRFSDPHYFDPLEMTNFGQVLIAIAAGLWIAAIFSARKILAVQL